MKLFSLIIFLKILLTQTLLAQCSTLIQMVDIGIEGCSLPVVLETNQVVFPCSAPVGFWSDITVGEYAYINYDISLGCSNVCQATSTYVEITCYNLVTSIENQSQNNEIRILPTLTYSKIIIEAKGVKSVDIFNSQGVPVIPKADLMSGILDVSELVAGMYFVSVRTNSSTRVIKFVKI